MEVSEKVEGKARGKRENQVKKTNVIQLAKVGRRLLKPFADQSPANLKKHALACDIFLKLRAKTGALGNTVRTDVKKIRNTMVASRLLTLSRGGKEILIEIAQPVPDKEGDWECKFAIRGLRKPVVEYGRGVDSLQALILAIEGIRFYLQKTGKRFSWYDDDEDIGLPRYVPTMFGSKFTAHLNAMIDKELDDFTPKKQKKFRRSKE